jgi:hypothetical protein
VLKTRYRTFRRAKGLSLYKSTIIAGLGGPLDQKGRGTIYPRPSPIGAYPAYRLFIYYQLYS